MGKSPFRRDVPDRNPKANRGLPSINEEFKDISDPKEMLEFIKKNRSVLNNQDAEIDNHLMETQTEEEPSPTPYRMAADRGVRRTQQPIEENIVEEELEQYRPPEPPESKEELNTDQAPQTSPKGFKQIDLSKLDPATRKRIEDSMKDRPNQKVITNTPTGAEVAITAPPISNVQMRRKILEEEREARAKNTPEIPSPFDIPKTETRFNIRGPSNAIEYDWERFEPVSGGIFYESSAIFVRRFNLIDTMRVSNAMEAGDITAFIDALGNCVQAPFNIRDLSYPDFRHLLYWHWFNSYTKVPHDLGWTSKYGNRNMYKVTETNLQLITPKIDRVTYQEWAAKGYAVPTLRDVEIFMKETLTKEEVYVLSRAQYFASDPEDPSIQSKIDTMTDLCMKSTLPIQELPDFKQAIYHEVVENVDVVDSKFDPVAWVKVLRGQVEIIQKEIEKFEAEGDTLSALDRDDERINIEEDIARLEDGINNKKGGAELADVETLRLDRPILEFFPSL